MSPQNANPPGKTPEIDIDYDHLDVARIMEGIKASVAARPEDPPVQRHNALAYAAFLNRDLDLAEEHVTRSLQIDPRQADTLRLREEIARLRSAMAP